MAGLKEKLLRTAVAVTILAPAGGGAAGFILNKEAADSHQAKITRLQNEFANLTSKPAVVKDTLGRFQTITFDNPDRIANYESNIVDRQQMPILDASNREYGQVLIVKFPNREKQFGEKLIREQRKQQIAKNHNAGAMLAFLSVASIGTLGVAGAWALGAQWLERRRIKKAWVDTGGNSKKNKE